MIHKGANDNGGNSQYRKRTFDDGLTLSGAAAFNHEVKLAGGPTAWAIRETARAYEASLEAGIRTALKVFEDTLRAEDRLIDVVSPKRSSPRAVG